MSEFINNYSQRKEKIKEALRQIHEGKPYEQVKSVFAEILSQATAGEIAEIEIDLWSISLIFNTGHRIGLHVSSSNFPRFEVNPNTGKDFPVEGEPMALAANTVYTGVRHPSALILPVAP